MCCRFTKHKQQGPCLLLSLLVSESPASCHVLVPRNPMFQCYSTTPPLACAVCTGVGALSQEQTRCDAASNVRKCFVASVLFLTISSMMYATFAWIAKDCENRNVCIPAQGLHFFFATLWYTLTRDAVKSSAQPSFSHQQ